MMRIEVIAAWPNRCATRVVDVPAGSTAAEACAASGLAEGYPLAGMAVFGRRVSDADVLRAGDRLELLRALVMDPKQARRQRAETARALKTDKAR